MSADNKNETQAAAEPIDTDRLIAERRAKLTEMRSSANPFPNDFERRNVSADVHATHSGKTKEELEASPVSVQLAGRMLLKRVMGKASFATLQDMGGRIQIYVTNDGTGVDVHQAFKHWDIGDILGVEGTLFRTRTGELTIQARSLRLLAKALRPLPEKFHGLTDQDTRYRQRYVDLITNEETRLVFRRRSQIVQEIRAFMVDKGYLEVETPMMQPIPGGASAKPFETHHNALDMKLYLRIAPELYLKRLVVGGFEKVFEINRNFRNEGISTRHNPEFTMIEFYEAYRDHRYLMSFTEEMLRTVAQKVLGTTQVPYGDHVIDLDQPFARLTPNQAICRFNPEYSEEKLADRDFVVSSLKRFGVDARQTAAESRIAAVRIARAGEGLAVTVIQRLMNPAGIEEINGPPGGDFDGGLDFRIPAQKKSFMLGVNDPAQPSYDIVEPGDVVPCLRVAHQRTAGQRIDDGAMVSK